MRCKVASCRTRKASIDAATNVQDELHHLGTKQ
jgi:hypothetical protein